MCCFAHLDGSRKQTVAEHCRSAAQRASDCLRPIGLGQAAYLAGLLHDFGKCTTSYQTYLARAAAGEVVRRGSVIHAHGGARFLLEHYHPSDCSSSYSYEDMTAELLAYAVGAHHGLFDCLDEQHHWGFMRRLDWDDDLYRESCRIFFSQCAGAEELDHRFAQAHRELSPIYSWVNTQTGGGGKDLFFHLGLLARLLLSAVIEGDRWDTARFMSDQAAPPPPAPNWKELLERVERKLDKLPCETPVQKARRTISRQCREAAKGPGGIYRLNVPTGGGKTLSSLRYALAHAAAHGKSRLIFTAPLLAILDQNADVLRDYIQDDSLILEHHSNLVQTEADGTALDTRELMTENWDAAPIIITTLAQLLNTLFDGRTTCIRRFQALSNCVLVIDEVQTVPPRMLTLFNLAMGFLAQVCRATVILCSATQPSLANAHHPIPVPVGDLIPYDPDLWAPFRRTHLADAGSRPLENIPDFLAEQLEPLSSLLAACNLKHQARFLYQRCKGPEHITFHLSAEMCPAHRRAVLDQMTAALDGSRNGGPKVLCVSTQVMEAGIDLSFGGTVRLAAGLDNAIQTAGRGNRNRESETSAPAWIVSCADERLGMLREIQNAKTACLQLLWTFRQDPGALGGSLSSQAAIAYYYTCLYGGMQPGSQDYLLRDGGDLYDLLSTNNAFAAGQPGLDRFGLRQAFSLAGQLFQVFDQDTIDVLVPYGDGEKIIANLSAPCIRRDRARQRELLGQAKPFTLSLYRSQRDLLHEKGGLYSILDGTIWVLRPQYYDQETGLNPDVEWSHEFWEV